MSETRETHPTFGMIQFCRVSGAGRLFGSPLPQHYGTIRVRISAGERIHEHSEDRYRAKAEYIEIEMSASQFAEAITCMNVGDGVPCTIWHRNGQRTGEVPDTEAGETQRAEVSFRERVGAFLKAVKTQRSKIEGILAKDRLSKDDKAEVRALADHVVREVEQNLPFFVTLFTESAEKVKVKAKAEIAAMMDHAVRMFGLAHVERLNGDAAAPELPAHEE